jgi:hypothetical protein
MRESPRLRLISMIGRREEFALIERKDVHRLILAEDEPASMGCK